MPTFLRCISLLWLTASVSGVVCAELPVSTLSTGDLIILRSTADQLTPVLAGERAAGDFKAPSRTKFKVNLDEGGELTMVVKDVPCEPVKASSPSAAASAAGAVAPAASAAASSVTVARATRVSQTVSSITVSDEDCKLTPLVVEGRSYTMNAKHLEKFGFRRLGFIYGGLIIPYKYFRHDKSLEPGTTMGPFLGYRFGQTGWGVSVIASYAVSDIKVKVKDGTELKERTFFALSRGLGFMFDVTKSETPFRAGIMWGRDRVGSNNVDVYPHDGRTWVAAQLGWEFGR